MALADVPGLIVPALPAVGAFTAVTMSVSGAKVAFIFRAPKTGNIDRGSFRTTAVTLATNTDLRLETVDILTTGDATGTLLGVNSNVIIPSASITANTFIEGTFGAATPVTKGDLLALVIAPSAIPNYAIGRLAVPVNNFALPYSESFSASWTKSSTTLAGAIRYDDGNYYNIPNTWPISNVAGQGFTSATTPDEMGNLINLPFKCRAAGIVIDTQTTSAASNFTARIYDAADVVLASKLSAMIAVSGTGQVVVPLDNSPELDANTDYRIAIEAMTTINRSIRYVDVLNTDLAEALPLGNRCQWTQRTNGGAWSQTATRRASIALLIDQLDDGAGGGGGGGSGAFAYGYAS